MDSLITIYGAGMLVFGIVTASIVTFDLATGRWKRFRRK